MPSLDNVRRSQPEVSAPVDGRERDTLARFLRLLVLAPLASTLLLGASVALAVDVVPNWPRVETAVAAGGGAMTELQVPIGFEGLLDLIVEGGDGGNARAKWLGATAFGVGGPGALVRATFSVGPGPDEIPGGSTLRFIVGSRGESANEALVADVVEHGGGGGAGTAAYVQRPGEAGWELLVGAGGGGGGWALVFPGPLLIPIPVSGDGRYGRYIGDGEDGSHLDGGEGGGLGDGGDGGVFDALTQTGGGGEAGKDGAGGGGTRGKGDDGFVFADGNRTRGGGQAGPAGVSRGGALCGPGNENETVCRPYSGTAAEKKEAEEDVGNGGSGWGGGGAALSSGGGGGGLSGGGGGGNDAGGGGGGSFVSSSAVNPSINGRAPASESRLPQDGRAAYALYPVSGSRVFAEDTTVTSDFTIFGIQSWVVQPGVVLTLKPGVDLRIDAGGSISNAGTIVNEGAIENFGGTIDNLAGGIISNITPGSITNTGVIANAGAIYRCYKPIEGTQPTGIDAVRGCYLGPD